MAPIAWMAGACIASWLAATAVAGARVNPEMLLGMIGPLGSACATWVAAQRAYRSAPERLMRVMLGGFALKLLFFAAYVAVMLRGLALRPVPFVLSLVGYLMALYAIEALFLRRLVASPGGGEGPRNR